MNKALLSSKDPKWRTPPDVVELVRAFFGGPPDLDPCSEADSLVGARRDYRLEERGEDGLALPWRGRVYCNPPYGRGLLMWLLKAEREARVEGAEILLLCPARTDTAWFRVAWAASAVAFLRGRLKFVGAESSAPFPSAPVLWSPTPDASTERLSAVLGDRAQVAVALP